MPPVMYRLRSPLRRFSDSRMPETPSRSCKVIQALVVLGFHVGGGNEAARIAANSKDKMNEVAEMLNQTSISSSRQFRTRKLLEGLPPVGPSYSSCLFSSLCITEWIPIVRRILPQIPASANAPLPIRNSPNNSFVADFMRLCAS